ncbi:hypothetical protein BDQ17DRAFT_1438229 [Cyathus striatus]|nr:hypothetical protein BDQ17DRAFT_1438229 [Cyathus striatus]
MNIEYLTAQPYNKDNQYIRAPCQSAFKDIQLDPLFWVTNQIASSVFDKPDTVADFAAAARAPRRPRIPLHPWPPPQMIRSFQDRQAPTRVLPDGAVEEYQEDGERYVDGVR